MSSSAITTQVAQLKIGSVQNQADSTSVYSAGVWSFKNSTALTSVTITDAGRVLIGTTTGTGYPLTVKTDTDFVIGMTSTSAGTGARLLASNLAGTVYKDLTIDGSQLICSVSGTERMRIDASGNVLVAGTTGGTGRLRLIANGGDAYSNGGSACFVNTGGNYWNIVTSSSGSGSHLYLGYAAGDRGYFSSSTGAYTAISDRRLKKNIQDISYGIAEVMNLRPVSYNMSEQEDTDVKALGFIAQEVLQVLPEAVSEMQSGMYGLDKNTVIPVLVKAIQEQQAMIESMKAEIEALKAK